MVGLRLDFVYKTDQITGANDNFLIRYQFLHSMIETEMWSSIVHLWHVCVSETFWQLLQMFKTDIILVSAVYMAVRRKNPLLRLIETQGFLGLKNRLIGLFRRIRSYITRQVHALAKSSPIKHSAHLSTMHIFYRRIYIVFSWFCKHAIDKKVYLRNVPRPKCIDFCYDYHVI